jgi:peptidoglycan pentaglycine glycine transferase (the first glycine)
VIEIDRHPPAQEWDAFVAAHPNGHLLQTSAWGQLKSAFGWSASRVAVRTGDAIAAGAQILFRRLPLGATLAYVPKGPLVDWADEEVLQALTGALAQKGHSQRAIMLKIEPDLLDSASPPQLAELGFQAARQTIQPRRTILVDISSDEGAILGAMKSKTRYNIRLAERKEVRVFEGSRQDVDVFARLMDVTGERDSFGVHSLAYYRLAYDLFQPLDMARLFIARYEEQPIAGLMAFASGQKAWYMFGASGNEHRERMPNYALQWAAIRWARSRACHTYDLWGVPDAEEEVLEAQFTGRQDGLWGVYRFKRGFGGRLVRYVGAFDHVYNQALYRLYHLALRLRSVGAWA